eukprot:1580066-Alexandrium_andersonii.AAC.1
MCIRDRQTLHVRARRIDVVLPLQGDDAAVHAVLHAAAHAVEDHADAMVVQLGHREGGLPRVGLAE